MRRNNLLWLVIAGVAFYYWSKSRNSIPNTTVGGPIGSTNGADLGGDNGLGVYGPFLDDSDAADSLG